MVLTYNLPPAPGGKHAMVGVLYRRPPGKDPVRLFDSSAALLVPLGLLGLGLLLGRLFATDPLGRPRRW